ncbi:MAG: hypothetical protein NVSMB64_11520 [Candidatus Velthaea sp.]
MAIRPSDLQGAIFQSAQTAAVTQRAEEAPRQAAQTAQAVFSAHVTQREETIEASSEAEGNRVKPNPERERPGSDGRQRRRKAGDPFEDAVDDAAGFDEPPHLIDFTA